MKIGYLMQKGEEIRRPPYNGPANHVYQVIHCLQDLGHQVRLLFGMQDGLWITEDLELFKPVNLHRPAAAKRLESGVRRIQSELKLPYLGLFESLHYAQACYQELKDCDIFLERISWMTYGGLMAAKRQRIPLVLEYNGDPIADLRAKGELPRGLQFRISRSIMSRSLRSADALVATGDGWRQNLIEQWQVDSRRIATIENGTSLVDLLQRNQLRSFEDCRNPLSPLKLVYLGGFYPWHGLTILLGALAKTLAQGQDFRLVLIGSGTGESEAKELVEELGLSDRVQFLGQLTDREYALHLAEADIGLSPYCGWLEYSGLKLFDYKAAGLPTIASGEHGKPITLRHGDTGWIVPPCEQDALVQAIIYLGGNPELRRAMGRRSRIEAENEHRWEHTALKIEQVLQGALAA